MINSVISQSHYRKKVQKKNMYASPSEGTGFSATHFHDHITIQKYKDNIFLFFLHRVFVFYVHFYVKEIHFGP